MSTMILTFPASPAAGTGSAPSGPAGGRPRLHLAVAHRRRRLGAVLALLVFVLAVAAVVSPAVAGLAGGAGTPPGAAGPSSSASIHVVRPGDTLWSIAAAHAPERDVRFVVDELVELNGRAPIVPGQRLVMPQ